MSDYATDAADALADITEAGAPVTFPGVPATAPVYDPATDTWSAGSAAGPDIIGQAVQVAGDPDRFSALGLVLVNPVSLMVAASGLPASVVLPGKTFVWAGVTYTVRDSGDTVAPNGVPILFFPTGTT